MPQVRHPAGDSWATLGIDVGLQRATVPDAVVGFIDSRSIPRCVCRTAQRDLEAEHEPSPDRGRGLRDSESLCGFSGSYELCWLFFHPLNCLVCLCWLIRQRSRLLRPSMEDDRPCFETVTSFRPLSGGRKRVGRRVSFWRLFTD